MIKDLNIDIPFSASFLIEITCPSDKNIFLLESAKISDKVNDLFEINLVVGCESNISIADLIGRTLDLKFKLPDNSKGSADKSRYRHFNGIVTHIQRGLKVLRGFRSYNITLKPQFWLLSQHSDHRIWSDKSTTDVLQILLQEHGLPPADISGVIGSVPKVPYSVQYGESDFTYIVRRMEEDGLFWWFSHKTAVHTLHVANDASGWLDPVDMQSTRVLVRDGAATESHIFDWQSALTYVPDACSGRDWNFETPKITIEGKSSSPSSVVSGKTREIYEYPSRSATIEDVERTSTKRMQAFMAEHDQIQGQSDVRTLEAGRRFQPYSGKNCETVYKEYVVTSIDHEISAKNDDNNNKVVSYTNKFNAILSSVPLPPKRKTPLPKIHGTQIATVAGPDGEEIYTDKYGRVKLYFPWDRKAKKNGSDTCWVRVGQVWSGKNWGAGVIPRIGMEVIVTFEEGNPDRPLIVGTVPNADYMPVYELPTNKTRMVLRSNTHKGTGFNEISFEDTAGQENQFFHAQKDRSEHILNNATKRVDTSHVLSIGKNHAYEVGGYQKQEIGGSMNLTVGGVGSEARDVVSEMSDLSGQSAQLLSQGNDAAGGDAGVEKFSAALSSGFLGYFDTKGLQARDGVVAGKDPGADAGTELASSGDQMGQAIDRMFTQSGTMNTVVASYKSNLTGIACVEQVGSLKVTNVGKVFFEKVGNLKKTIVGEKLVFEVGGSKITLKSSGEVKITGKSLDMDFSGTITLKGKTIQLN